MTDRFQLMAPYPEGASFAGRRARPDFRLPHVDLNLS
jgi:hypothetical protein